MDNPDLYRQEREAIVRALLDEKANTVAEETLKSLIAQDPEHVPYYVLLGSVMKAQDKADLIIPTLTHATKTFPELPLYRSSNYQSQQQNATARGLPSIFLNTQFKSGSVFLRDALERGLSMPWQFLSVEGVTPTLVDDWLIDFSRGGALCQHHRFFDDDLRENMAKISNAKLVLHLRDPRQSALSAAHHFERVLIDGPDYARRNLLDTMPPDYANWPFERKLDLYFELVDDVDYTTLKRNRQTFATQVEWIDRWLEAVEQFAVPLEVILTDYQDLANGQGNFMAMLLDKLDISRAEFDFNIVKDRPDPGVKHYRKGDPNEWRSVLSEAQTACALKLMTPRLLDRYGV